jgi:hypothetical protein
MIKNTFVPPRAGHSALPEDVEANLPFEFLRAVSPSASFRINKVEP